MESRDSPRATEQKESQPISLRLRKKREHSPPVTTATNTTSVTPSITTTASIAPSEDCQKLTVSSVPETTSREDHPTLDSKVEPHLGQSKRRTKKISSSPITGSTTTVSSFTLSDLQANIAIPQQDPITRWIIHPGYLAGDTWHIGAAMLADASIRPIIVTETVIFQLWEAHRHEVETFIQLSHAQLSQAYAAAQDAPPSRQRPKNNRMATHQDLLNHTVYHWQNVVALIELLHQSGIAPERYEVMGGLEKWNLVPRARDRFLASLRKINSLFAALFSGHGRRHPLLRALAAAAYGFSSDWTALSMLFCTRLRWHSALHGPGVTSARQKSERASRGADRPRCALHGSQP